MEQTNKRGFDWFSLVMGIIFLFAAWLVFAHPGESTLGFVYAFGIIAILNGIRYLFLKTEVQRTFGESSGWLIVIGILDIIFGIALLFGGFYSAVVVGYLFAFWYLLDSILTLVVSKYFKGWENGYHWFLIIFGILGIIIGIALLFNPFFALDVMIILIGIWFAIFGIVDIIEAF